MNEPCISTSILIVGAGATGIGAVSRLFQHSSMLGGGGGFSSSSPRSCCDNILINEDEELPAPLPPPLSYLIVEEADRVGGFAKSTTTAEGFLFDFGGHITRSNFNYVDDLMSSCSRSDKTAHSPESSSSRGPFLVHNRLSYAVIKGSLIPYPFWENTRFFPPSEELAYGESLVEAELKARWDAVSRAREVALALSKATPTTFTSSYSSASSEMATTTLVPQQHQEDEDMEKWSNRVMGEKFSKDFYIPLMRKMWAYPPSELSSCWVGGKAVKTRSFRQIVDSILTVFNEKRIDPPRVTNTFKYHISGTGGFWKSAFDCVVQPSNVLLKTRVVSIGKSSSGKKVATLSDGKRVFFKTMLTSAPLDETLALVGRPDLGAGLHFSGTTVIGIGVRGVPHLGSEQLHSWILFPDDDTNFFRVTVMSHYAPGNVPEKGIELETIQLAGDSSRPQGEDSVKSDEGDDTKKKTRNDEDDHHTTRKKKSGPYWSLLFEISESVRTNPLGIIKSASEVLSETLKCAVGVKLLQPDDEIVSVYHEKKDKTYPTPTIGRDDIVDAALLYLRKSHSIWSRGRFGTCKFEIADQDQCVMQGVEAVDSILFGTCEKLLATTRMIGEPTLTRYGTLAEMRWILDFELPLVVREEK